MVLTHGPFEAPPGTGKAEGGGGKKGKKEGTKREGRQGEAATFPAMVEYMDKIVGRLVAAVERTGVKGNTLILFTGDNGCPKEVTTRFRGRDLQGGKGSMLDTGSHVALVASWPGVVPAGKVSDALVDFTDFFPTIAEATGARVPEGVKVDGKSFLPILRGGQGPRREWVFVQLGNRKWIRDERWKLGGNGELYDLKADPWEERPIKDSGGEAGAARARLSGEMEKLK